MSHEERWRPVTACGLPLLCDGVVDATGHHRVDAEENRGWLEIVRDVVSVSK
jgi:hypothetical protein